MTSKAAKTSARFIYEGDAQIEDLGDGIRRQILGYGPDLMAVRVWFDTGSVGSVHSHPHSQTCYIESGRFRATVAGEETELGPGDGYYAGPDEPHGAVCLQAGALLDIFSPVRQDFLADRGAAS